MNSDNLFSLTALVAAFVFLMGSALLAESAHAQAGSITGTVTDSTTGEPLPGVNVVIAGTQQGASTGAEGTFEIPGLDPGAYDVQASFVGYTPKTVTDVQVSTGEATLVDIALSEGAVQLEEVVAVGYGTQRREDVTGSVSSIDVDEANVGLTSSPQELIQGRAAGVSVLKNDGEPGGGVTVRIRGGTSINASNEPLYVVDGVPLDGSAVTPGGQGVGGEASGPRNPLSLLNPNDIESIDVLKDASATAIYGARGANGVVLVTTKSGEAGQVTIDYNGSVSASTPSRELDLLSASQYESFVREQVAACNIGCDDDTGEVIDDDGDGTPDRIQALGSANTNWQDAVLRNSVSQRHSLAFSGGSEATQYRASLSYENQEGVVISSAQQKITGRVNASHTMFDSRLNLDLNLTSAYVEDDNILYNETGGFEGALFTNVFKFNPTNPVEQEDGDFFEIGTGAQGVRNPVAIAREIEDFAETSRTIGNLSADVQIVGGLSANANLGLERSTSVRDIYFPISNPIGATNNGEAYKRENGRSSALIELTANYNGLVAGDHSINAVAGYSYQNWINDGFGAQAQDFISDRTSYNNLGGSLDRTLLPYSFKSENRLISFFGRFNYDYDSRYLVSLSLRRDGSSRFGENNAWGLFPAASIAWRVNNDFDLPSAVTSLKVRAGFGVVGSQDFTGTNFNPNYPDLELLAPGVNAYFGGDQPFNGVAPTQFANPDITWEETATYNAGVDYSFLDGRLSGAIDVYRKDTDDLLLEVDVPQPAVVATQLQNIGSVRNTGLEFALEALAVDREDFTVSLGATFSTNKNEVIDIGEKQQIITGTVSGAGLTGTQSQLIKPGFAIGTFIGPEFIEVRDGRQVFNNYIDEDDDGFGDTIDEDNPTTTEPGPEDRVVIGSAQPDFEYGLNGRVSFQNWDLGVFLRGVQGRDLLNNTALEYATKGLVNTNVNFLEDALNDGVALDFSSPIHSSRWVQNASFIRLESLTLGYTFDSLPQVRRARVYVSGNNLFVLTPYDGYDPEVNTGATGTGSIGIDYLNYPKPRTFTLGVDLSF